MLLRTDGDHGAMLPAACCLKEVKKQLFMMTGTLVTQQLKLGQSVVIVSANKTSDVEREAVVHSWWTKLLRVADLKCKF